MNPRNRTHYAALVSLTSFALAASAWAGVDPVAVPGGPYFVVPTGSLSLDGSASLPSDGQTITAYDWDLNNDGLFDEAISGVTPAAISVGDLQSLYGMTIGANTIKLRVTDSGALTSTVDGTVTLTNFTSTTTQPAISGADIGYWNPNIPTTAAGSDKWFYENSGAGQPKGQTFTVAGDTILKSVSFRLNATKKAPVNNYLVRIGTVDTATNTFYELHSEVINQPNFWNPANSTDCYGIWTLATPVTLPVNSVTGSTLYAFDITFVGPSNTDWSGGGIPYPRFENSNVYANGAKYTTALGGAAGIPTNAMQMDSTRDREFRIAMDSTTVTDTTAPTLTSINDQVGGGPIYADQVQVTYILNFDEAVDASTIDLADFENLGSGVSIDSVVSVAQTTPFPVASVVKVVLGISGTGTLQLGVKSSSNIADMYGNSVNSPVADDTTITVLAGTNPGGGTRYWDGTLTSGTTDGVSQGGTATWDTTTTNWDRGFGFANPVVWSDAGTDSVVFGGTAGTVTLDADRTLQDMTFSVPSASGTGYFIGDAAEDNTLNFTGTKTVTLTATGTGTNQDATIYAGIAGSPTMNIAGRATNSVNNFSLLPTSGVTQTIGTLNMLNTLASNKRLILGGESTGNVVNTVTWSVTGNQLMLTKAGAGSWTINNDLAFNTGGSRASRLYVEKGTLTLGGTNNYLTHKIGVATNRETTFTASNQISRLNAKGTITIGDNREYLYVQNNGTLAPGPGVETLTVRWNANSNATTTHAQFKMQTGSTYEWDVASSVSTDVIDVQTGGSNFANLILENITLKINDAGAASAISPTDELTVFTYETAQPVTRSIGTVSFDTSALGAGWTVGTLALTDDGAGRIYLTGLSFSTGGGPTYATWSGGAAANVDTNGDGVSNGVAWALGAANVNANAIGLLPTLDNSDPTFFIFNFNRSNDAEADSTTAISVQYGSDLSGWTAATDNGSTVLISTTPGSPTTAVQVKIDRSLAVGNKLFARLNVVVTP